MRFLYISGLIALVILRFYSTRHNYSDGQELRITSIVYSEPNIYDNAIGFEIAGITTIVPRYPEIEYWDRVVIEGQVKAGKLVNPKIKSISKSNLIFVIFRKKLITFVKSALVEPHASLVSGIVLGSKSGISKQFWENLTKTSTAHVVVASGMNVTLLAGFILNSLILFVSRKRAVIVTVVAIWFYSLLSGFDAPIVRASVMGTISFSALALGKLSKALNALILSALVMLLLNPDWLINLGFILSFMATLSLILFQAKVDSKLQFVPLFFREGLSTSLSAQVGVAPILFFAFGQINLLSPFINALILWTVPYIMILGTVASIIGIVLEPLGRIVIYLVYPLTWWFVGVVNIFS